MNPLAIARLATNIMVTAFGLALLSVYAFTQDLTAELVVWLGGVAVLGGVVQFVVSAIYPRSIRPTWDEMAVASHRGAYQFGYWCAVVAFWLFFFLTQYSTMNLEGALLALGVLLICAPSAWMAVAALRK
ncbi:hypothetical protein [Breoghania sp.]|uniref:hypothetical protein n=1 Tax=Breoghania sp. TaxID=2065378 RepID=UPI0029CA3358|nr:hypothetical protein [Breoghania sp.]